MIKRPSVSVAFMTPLFKYAESQGISGDELCRAASLDGRIVQHPQERIRLPELDRLITSAIQLTGQADLGLRLAQTLHVEMAGILGYLMMNCQTIDDALRQYCKYQDLARDFIRISYATNGITAMISWDFAVASLNCQAVFLEIVAATVMVLAQELTGKDFPLIEVQFQHPAPAYAASYDNIFRTKVIFEASQTALIFKHENLELPVRLPNRELFSVMDRQAAASLHNLTGLPNLTTQARMILRQEHTRLPDIGRLAKDLGMNVRSLQLKLKEDGCTFRNLKDELLLERAVNLLLNSRLSITEISRNLGFSEPGAFHRSFRRWTGKSPGEYRHDPLPSYSGLSPCFLSRTAPKSPHDDL